MDLRRARRCTLLAFAAVLAVASSARGDSAPGGAAVPLPASRSFATVLGGIGADMVFSDLFDSQGRIDFTRDRVGAFAVGGEIGRVWSGRLGFEIESMYAHHFGQQTYHEFALTMYARWHAFPWDRWLDTSFAVGLGPSYTTEIPLLEAQRGYRSRLLNQLNLELAAALPHLPRHELLLRLQHRSGVFGLIDDVRDGSDFVKIGYRHRF